MIERSLKMAAGATTLGNACRVKFVEVDRTVRPEAPAAW